jgi:CPA1 family monovalent cation:H+ antiporter
MRAALSSLDGDQSGVALAVREEYEAALTVAGNPETPQAATDHDRLRLQAVRHQRRVLEELRSRGEIGDEAYHRIEEEIDWAELDAAPAGSFQPLTT